MSALLKSEDSTCLPSSSHSRQVQRDSAEPVAASPPGREYHTARPHNTCSKPRWRWVYTQHEAKAETLLKTVQGNDLRRLSQDVKQCSSLSDARTHAAMNVKIQHKPSKSCPPLQKNWTFKYTPQRQSADCNTEAETTFLSRVLQTALPPLL